MIDSLPDQAVETIGGVLAGIWQAAGESELHWPDSPSSIVFDTGDGSLAGCEPPLCSQAAGTVVGP